MKHHNCFHLLFAALAAVLVMLPSHAQDFGGPFGEEDLFAGPGGGGGQAVQAQLISDLDAIQPGQRFMLGLNLKLQPGWHVYWQNPEGPGYPVSVSDWKAPEGFEISDIHWPAPHRFEFDGEVQFGYADEVTLIFDVIAPQNIQPGQTVTFSTTADWLACKDSCIPGNQNVTIDLPVQATAAGNATDAATINQARQQFPTTLDNWTITASPTTGGYVLKLTAPGNLPAEAAKDLYFYSSEQYAVDPAVEQVATVEGNTITLPLKMRTRDSFGSEVDREGPVTQLTGVLVSESGLGDSKTHAIRIDVPIKGEVPPAPPVDSSTLLLSLGAAFVGGLILNLMPCVFPVLSIKILGFVKQAGEDKAIVRRHGYAFGVGVLISFWVLAGVLLALRAAAAKAGGAETFSWGFQMQNTAFVFGMILLVFLIGLNLAGVFEIGMGLTSVAGKAAAGSEGYTKSFLSGVLATLIATPCTAPFMAGALGAALTMPTFQAMLIFTALGVGMAVPYVLLSCVPALLNYLPKPGPWMESFKQAMAFPMFATAAWLIWVYVGLTNEDMIVWLIIGLTVVAMGAWVYGRWSTPMRVKQTQWIARVIAAALVILGVGMVQLRVMTQEKAEQAALAAAEAGEYVVEWLNYSPAKGEELRKEGRPVLVDFTARWCISCQANKKSSLRGVGSTEKLYNDLNVALVEADYTKKDAVIGKTLTEYGRDGVPLYLVFPADGGEPEILPNLLTPEIVADALRRAAGDAPSRAAAN